MTPDTAPGSHARYLASYAEWMATASGQERLEFLRGSLDAYARKVAAEGGSQYAPTYPLLLQVLTRAAEQAAHALGS